MARAAELPSAQDGAVGLLTTVAVFVPGLYEELFTEAVASNGEGSVSARAVPFKCNTLDQTLRLRSAVPGDGAGLELAWQHRRTLRTAE